MPPPMAVPRSDFEQVAYTTRPAARTRPQQIAWVVSVVFSSLGKFLRVFVDHYDSEGGPLRGAIQRQRHGVRRAARLAAAVLYPAADGSLSAPRSGVSQAGASRSGLLLIGMEMFVIFEVSASRRHSWSSEAGQAHEPVPHPFTGQEHHSTKDRSWDTKTLRRITSTIVSGD